MTTQQEEVLRSMEYQLGQLNKDLATVRVKVEEFYNEIDKDLTLILVNMKIYDNVVHNAHVSLQSGRKV